VEECLPVKCDPEFNPWYCKIKQKQKQQQQKNPTKQTKNSAVKYNFK
jgi:hypothetical protein